MSEHEGQVGSNNEGCAGSNVVARLWGEEQGGGVVATIARVRRDPHD